MSQAPSKILTTTGPGAERNLAVSPRSAAEAIGAGSALGLVVARLAEEPVGSAAAVHDVGSGGALEPVGTAPADDPVAVVVSPDPVLAALAVDLVLAAATTRSGRDRRDR